MMMWMRGTNLWSVLLLGLGVMACDGTALVGAQSPVGSGGSSPMGGAGTGAPVGDGPAEGLDTSADAGWAGPWIFFDSLRALNRDIYAILPDGSSLRRLTVSPAIDREPAVSPDGRTLAFASDRNGTFQVYLMPLPGGVVRQLTRSTQGADQPAWSPDGKHLAFRSGLAVHLIGVDGQGERPLPRVTDSIETAHPTFASNDVLVFDSYNRIDSVDLRSGSMKSIVPGWTTAQQHPAISPDGHTLAFSVICDVNGIWLTSVENGIPGCQGGTRVALSGFARFPSISATGLIAFERGEAPSGSGPAPGPARIGLADGALRVIDVTHGEGDDRNAAWSPASLVLP